MTWVQSDTNRAARLAEVDEIDRQARLDEIDAWDAALLAKLEAERATGPRRIRLRAFTMRGTA